jgi:hypothetical protein
VRVYKSSVLIFSKKPEISFTKNGTERDLRISTAKQKVSRCFRKEVYAQAHCPISSHFQIMATI